MLLLAAPTLLALSPHGAAGSGGPDGYGYTWVDSRPPNPGVAFNWIPEGVTQGTLLSVGDDDCTKSRVSLGFNFGFYGALYSSAYVCANGFLAFGAPGSLVEFMENYIAVLAMDLDPTASGGGRVYAWARTTVSPRQFVVTWNGVYTWGTRNPQTFQVVLTESLTGDGSILMQYRTLTSVGYHVTGIENRTGTPSLFYTEPLGNNLAVLFLPPTGPRPPDVLQVEAQNLAPPAVEVGQADVPMIGLNLTLASGASDVTKVRVDLTGSFPFPTAVSRAELWLDDGDGRFDATKDGRIAASGLGGTPVRADLIPSPPLTVSQGTPRRVFVTYDISPSARVGDWIGAAIRNSTYVTVASPDTVQGVNLPLDTYAPSVRTEVRSGIDTLSVSQWSSKNPSLVEQWRGDVLFLSATFSASLYSATVERLTVRLGGVPPRTADVRLVKAFLDADDDGSLTRVQDPLLATAVFGPSLNATLFLNLTVTAARPRAILVVLDIAGNATLGNTLRLEIPNASYVRLPSGSGDVVSGANFPIVTANSTVAPGARPRITSQWASTPPVPDGILSPQEYVVTIQNSGRLGDVGGSSLDGYVVVQNDDRFVYVAIDAVGDRVVGASDGASVAFDQDRDDLPTPGGDGQFAIGGPLGGPAHLVYNATAGSWVPEDPCSELLDANHTGLRCVRGFGTSDLDSTPHRVYEFRIPLALLAVSTPIPPNTTVGFAAASAAMAGIVDGPPTPGNATWPFLFRGVPPLREFARLLLAIGPPPNTLPVLNWTGEPGFVGDGVDPDAGTQLDRYTFRVNYTDADADLPALGFPKLKLWLGASEAPGSPYALAEGNATDVDVRDGKVYLLTLTLSACPRAYRHSFVATDARGGVNRTPEASGPTVACAPNPPTLTNPSLSPRAGTVNETVFFFNVSYADADGDPPSGIFALVNKSGAPRVALPLTLASWIGEVGNYSQGARFSGSTNLTEKGADYTFSFNASDGRVVVYTPSLEGPTVVSDFGGRLTVSFFDEAPLSANVGARNVRMLTAILEAKVDQVRVTGFLADRMGDAADGDVAFVKLYHDVDATRSLSAPDVLLGTGTVISSRVSIGGFSLVVPEEGSVQILALVDVSAGAAPDNRIGLRLANASYLTVEAPDLVEPFPAFQTTLTLVNAPPTATNVRIEGHAPGSPEILRLVTAAPTFSWTFTDPNAGDLVQRAYNASVYSQATGALLWFRNESNANNSVAYAGPTLQPGRTYAFVLRLADARSWNAGVQVLFRLNGVPPGPIPTSPVNEQGVQPAGLRLMWTAVIDPDGDSVEYEWQLSTSQDFTTAVQSGTTVARETGVSVLGRTTYYWRVRATDGFQVGSYGPTATFTTAVTSGSIRGRVEGRGASLSGAVVGLFGANDVFLSETTTNSLGMFAFEGLPFGTYSLRITATGYREHSLASLEVTLQEPDLDIGTVTLQEGTAGPGFLEGLFVYLLFAALFAVAGGLAYAVARRKRGRKAADREALPKEYECPECGTRISAFATVCPTCGVEFEENAGGPINP